MHIKYYSVFLTILCGLLTPGIDRGIKASEETQAMRADKSAGNRAADLRKKISHVNTHMRDYKYHLLIFLIIGALLSSSFFFRKKRT